MPGIVEWPTVVRVGVEVFGHVFDNDCQRRHFAEYVCTTGKHYPLYFRRFKKESQCQADDEKFINHTELTIELIDQVCSRKIPGTFTWDSYFTNARILNHVHSQQDARGNPRARDWALCKLTTIGEASRAMLRETLRQTLTWDVDQIVTKSRKQKEVLMQLVLG